ncbi:hypothetical protein QIU18_00240 [Capnocytophaga canimorsus]|nr:hypothetical protein [Capnocytophaga canimorsus]WGU70622.1 hypothetical protein QIU18_00240 [Capnocytophaga canimorsus]
MIKQYPHFLFVITEEEAHQDDEGNWIGNSESVDFYAVCREETDGRGQEVQTAGGRFPSIFISHISSKRNKENR